MNNWDKVSILLGIQLVFVVALVGVGWIAQKYTSFYDEIPMDLLAKHRNRLGWYPLLPLAGYLVFSNLSRGSQRFDLLAGICFVLFWICFAVRALITIKSKPEAPLRLKRLAYLECFFSLLGAVFSGALYFFSAS